MDLVATDGLRSVWQVETLKLIYEMLLHVVDF